MISSPSSDNTQPAYKKLEVWKRARKLVLETYKATDTFPNREMYGITSQLRRSAISVVANIAEGSAKKGSREYRRYLDIALGSLAELDCLLVVSNDLGLLADDKFLHLSHLRNRTGKVLWKLYSYHRERV